jgi:hypothetical protein
MRTPTASEALLASLEASATAAGCPIKATAATWTRWASATFSGARHEITAEAAESPALDAWLTALVDGEQYPEILGYLLADIIVLSVARSDGVATVRLEALTVDQL